MKFFTRRELLVPTLWGWCAIALLAAAGCFAFVFSIHPFLSPVRPGRSDVLVVEGWVPDYALQLAAKDFLNRNCRLLVVTGGPPETGFFLTGYSSFAHICSATLKKMGVDSSKIIAVPSVFVQKDRTYEEGVAVKKWLSQSAPGVKSITLYSLGCHSRRSQLLFQKALGKGCSVGIVACPSRDYDAGKWWHYSNGIRAVADETLAYCYALLFYAFGS
ncbi:MAG TPA: ElyC/SanA/YdcF family protein [Chitinivibrionales bacterium]|nr:ElyC/SanA/YdcF family protein [Chitinivibrionales bacterium]